MRNLIVSAAALLACAIPGVAAAQDAYVDVYYGNQSFDDGTNDDDIDAIGVDGVAAFEFAQVGAHYANLDSDGSDVDAWGLDGHVFARNSAWQAGAGASYSNLDGGAGSDIDEWTVAAEGLYFLPQSTIAGSLSYGESDLGGGGSTDVDFWAVDAEYRYFINDNFKVAGNVGFGNADVGPADADLWNAGVSAEYQFSAVPVSVFGGYEHTNLDDADLEGDAFKIGARWNFGGNTLFDRDRNGANVSSPRGIFGRLLGS